MSRPRTNVCLSMIVKNEVEVLPRLLRSVKDVVDSYVIVDTGSTDGTVELIRREMSGYAGRASFTSTWSASRAPESERGEIQRPDDQLFLAQEVYDWRMLDELGIAAHTLRGPPG